MLSKTASWFQTFPVCECFVLSFERFFGVWILCDDLSEQTSHLHWSCVRTWPLKMEEIDYSETSAYKMHTSWHHPKERTQQTKSHSTLLYNTHIAIHSTYSERASKADDWMLRGNINRCTWKWTHARKRGGVDHHTTFTPFVLAHVLEPQ